MAYDPDLVRLAGVDPDKLPPLVPTGSVIGTVTDAVAADLGLPDGVQVVTGTPDLHSAACGAGARRRLPDPPGDQHHVVDQLPGAVQEDRHPPPDRDRAGPRCRRRPLRHRQQPRHVGPVPAVAARQRPRGRLGRLRPAERAGRLVGARERRRDVHSVADRRALPHRRPPRAGRLPQHVAVHDDAPTWSGRSWRVSPTTTGGCTRRSRSSPSAGSTTSASSAAGRSPTCGARSTPTSWTAPSSGSREPWFANLKGAAIFAGLGLGAVRPGEVHGLVEVDRVFTPDPSTREVYDRLYAEFPGLYRAQKGMFKRLNRPRRSDSG